MPKMCWERGRGHMPTHKAHTQQTDPQGLRVHFCIARTVISNVTGTAVGSSANGVGEQVSSPGHRLHGEGIRDAAVLG